MTNNHLHTYPDETSKLLWEESMIGLAFVSEDGKWLKANPMICNLLGYTESELQQTDFQRVTHPDDVYNDIEMTKRLGRDEIPNYVMTKRYITKRGEIIWIKLKVNKVHVNGKFVYFLAQIKESPIVGYTAERVEQMHKEGLSFNHFLKQNWKWFVSVLASLIVAIAGGIWHMSVMYHKIDANEAALEVISKNITRIEQIISGGRL